MGRFKLTLKLEFVRVTLETINVADPAFFKLAGWLFDVPTGIPPYQVLIGVTFKIGVGVEKAKFDAEIRKTPMMILIEANLPRALGESELMTASFNGHSDRGEGLGSTS